jgi:hypothetical protein
VKRNLSVQSCDDTHCDNAPNNRFGFEKQLKSCNTSYVERNNNFMMNDDSSNNNDSFSKRIKNDESSLKSNYTKASKSNTIQSKT